MTKRELIDEIVTINRTAEPAFLAHFEDSELNEYLNHLRVLRQPRLTGNSRRYDRFFENCPKISVQTPPSAVALAEPPAEEAIQEELYYEDPLPAEIEDEDAEDDSIVEDYESAVIEWDSTCEEETEEEELAEVDASASRSLFRQPAEEEEAQAWLF